MATAENATDLNKFDDDFDPLSQTATTLTGCLDANDFISNNGINIISSNSSSNNNNNITNLSDTCFSSINIVNTSHNEASYVSRPLKAGTPHQRDILSIHRAPTSKNRIHISPFINSSSSSNVVHIATHNDTHDGSSSNELDNKYSSIASGISPSPSTNNNICNRDSCYQDNSTENYVNMNNANKSRQENIANLQKLTRTQPDEQCSKNVDVHKDQQDESSELHTESSSVNTSQNSESSSGSNYSEDQTQKQESLNFSDPRQRQVFEALTGIQSLRKDGQFSDVIIRVKDREFRCHRFILSKCSPFLRAMINHAMDTDARVQGDDGTDTSDSHSDNSGTKHTRAISGNPVVIAVNGVEPHIFDKVLDYMYCVFDDVLSDGTTLELLLAADTFQLSNLSQTCVEHIADTVSVNNVFDIVSLVDSGCTSLGDNKVRIRCHQVLRENFLHLCCKSEFLGLNRQRMISLVADSMLAIKNEMDIIEPLIRWVSVRPSERCADLTLMLQLIRFPLMTSEDLDKLMDVPFLKENSLATALVDESKSYGMKDFPERMSWPRQNCISRCQFPSRDFILWTADRNKGLHLYSIIDGLHYKVTTFNEATVANTGFTFDSTSTVCCYGDRLFFTGGEFNTDLAWSVDSETGEISVHAKMPRGRKFHSMVASRGCIYCLGGQDKRGYTVLDSVDAYIISKGLWLKVGHMAVAAYNMTAVTSNGAIYLIGGVDHSGQPLRLIQCFAVLRSGLYSAFKLDISNMPPSLLSSRAVTSGLDGSVYIVCGHGEVYCLDTEKKFLHHVNTLKCLSQNPRVRFGLAHVGGCLVVTGGHQLGHMMQEPIRSVCMDIATKTEVKDYSPLLPADIVNTCFYAKLSSGILGFSKLSSPIL